MNKIIEFFESFAEGVDSIVDFVVTLFTSFVRFLTSLPAFIQILNNTLFTIPSTLVIFVSLSITISIIFLIINRGSSK